MIFILFHGAFGSSDGNWFEELKRKLESLGQSVYVPQFPIDDEKKLTDEGPKRQQLKQTLHNWLQVFERHFKSIPQGEKFCFIGHSLGCLFMLHAVHKFKIRL